ncbi:hypothetical protein [Haladaptatus caseinilyticus]|uniref:hypothetical protein n=1 Tax=Haladaptatus caseinilyticus TaxID=2993314 RepID=UPI00224B454D|nr:hypothetical protein [Haladaptatus caseinilyticus]
MPRLEAVLPTATRAHVTRSRTSAVLRLAATRGLGYRGRSAAARVRRDRDVTPVVSAVLSGR